MGQSASGGQKRESNTSRQMPHASPASHFGGTASYPQCTPCHPIMQTVSNDPLSQFELAVQCAPPALSYSATSAL